MSRLFEEPSKDDEPASNVTSPKGLVVGVSVNANVWDDYDYVFPDSLGAPGVAQRVRVPFGRGNRKTLGFVTEVDRPGSDRPLKAVVEIVDDQPQLDEGLMELARWISSYYLAPLGMVLGAMVPSAVGKRPPKTETVVSLSEERSKWPDSLGGRQKRILDELLEARNQGIERLRLESLLRHSGAGRDTIRRLLKRQLISTEVQPVKLEDLTARIEDAPFELNSDQKEILRALEPKLTAGKFSTTLLHGVTGSGKTEIYVQAIRKVVQTGRQAILLTPEIALTTQTLQRLLKRLPRLAVLHSGLTAAQRAFYWQQIRDGHASVIVGPRSAVFAPARKLGLIIVDEEHESSYKQDTAPCYHGRDVAIKRALIASVPVILGTATPSLESIHNAQQGRYDLLHLPRRVLGLPLPKLQIVHLREDMARGKVELLGRTLTNKMATALDHNHQIILLMNRRGYASYVFCPSCKWIMQCEECMRPMVWHRSIKLCTCHHCNKTSLLPESCPACKGKILLFGYGIQRIEDELVRKFPMARVARMDSDTMTSPKQFQKVLGEFGEGNVDILLGTQMVAKGLDFPNVSLVGVASADTSLTVHDFRASERTFQLIVQVAGRAGRAHTAGEVVVQTLHPEDPAIQFAEHHDYEGFIRRELRDRQEADLPPFSRVIRFIIRHEKVDCASSSADQLAKLLTQLLPCEQVRLIGPHQAEFAKLRNRFRFHILLITSRPGVVQQILHPQMPQITRSIPAEILPDVDPINLL